MPNDLAPVVDETMAQMREQLALERGRREATERFAASPRPAQAPPPPPEKDLFEDLGLTAEQKMALRGGVGQQIRGMVGPAIDQIRREGAQAGERKSYETALEMAMSLNPDIAQEQAKFAAASSATEFELRQNGRSLSPGEFIRESVKKYRELFPTDEAKKRVKAPPVDFTEGSSAPGAVAALNEKPDEPPKQTLLEKAYGEDPGAIIEVGDDIQEVLKKMNEDYAAGRNDYLADRGLRSFMPKVVQPLIKRRKARAAAAAK